MSDLEQTTDYALDLHCHTRERSGCSMIGEEALVRRAIRQGLAGVAFTDHHRLPPPGRLEKLNVKYHPFRVFTGIEISIYTAGGLQDFLVIGLSDPALEANGWTYIRLKEHVQKKGGWIAWAHPFRYNPILPREIKDNPPDALEIYSTNIKPDLAPRIEAAAREWGCQIIGSSDAHFLEEIGYSVILLPQPVASEAELVDRLKKGAFRAVREFKAASKPGAV